MARRHKPNRGIVLLVILTLLTLLIVVGLTFAVLSGQFRRAAEAGARQERYGDPPDRLLDRAMYQLARDTNDVNSVVRTHSLLGDIYGESLRGQQEGNSVVVAGGQFLDFTAQLPGITDTGLLTSISQGMRTAGFLNGCVLTFVSGNLKNVSTRIVGYRMDFSGATPVAIFRVLLPKRDDPLVAASDDEDQFIVNGRAFVGTGAGYDATTGNMDRQLTIGLSTFPHALLPNRVGEALLTTSVQYMQGGLNEPYDAADYQNVALAAMAPDPSDPTQLQVLPSFHRVALINYWMNHTSGMWFPTAASPDPNRYREFRRAVIFRPTPWDHPNFDGGNPALTAGAWDPGVDAAPGITGVDDDMDGTVDNPSELGWPGSDDVLTNDALIVDALRDGPWDVDCDGDGTRDAVWLDLGFPIQTDASGRRYKPLFAILCTDLDGRFNLNAHGDLSHVASVPPAAQTTPLAVTLPSTAGTVVSSDLPRAQGYGPPEISLMPLFASVAEYKQLLQGNLVLGIPGRYGLNELPGDNSIQALALLKLFEYPPPLGVDPTNYFMPSTPLASFSNPYDVRGELAFGLDWRGMPLHERSIETDVVSNTAYELKLSEDAPRGYSDSPVADMPFSMAELERLLRANDLDVFSLPDRLWHLVDAFRLNQTARMGVTTDSYDPPSPAILPWEEMQAEFAAIGMDRPRHIVDIVRTRLISERVAAGQLALADLDDPAKINQITNRLNSDLALLLSPETVMGVRFDVNRPFGNGVDDPSPVTGNRNNVVDEHGVGTAAFRGEEVSDETVWGGIQFDHDNDGVVGAADLDAFRARHLYAKHLYVLMMAIKPRNVFIDFDGDPSNDSEIETAYGIAQWAINVVDFRDSDSIMTPFEFDIYPFDDNSATNPHSTVFGWDVDGVFGINPNTGESDDLMPGRGLVWGCERPELLFSEAIALHDRRSEDLAVDGGTIGNDNNNDFDQRLRPRGSFFVELYNPWAGDDRAPGEFYFDQTNGSWAQGVMLNQVTPGRRAFPVWRILITKGGTSLDPLKLDPDHWDPAQRLPAGAIERSIYFTPFRGPSTGADTAYFTDLPVAPILPGRYAMIGSMGQNVDENGNPLDYDGDGNREFITTIGRRRDAGEISGGGTGLNYASTRRIVLEPSLDLNDHQAQVLGNLAVPAEPFPPDIQPSVGIVIDRPQSLSVTEPVSGYPNYGIPPIPPGPNGEVWDPTLADYEGAYFPALTRPFDRSDRTDGGDTTLDKDGTRNDYCMVYLQRLANPLLPYDRDANPYRTIDSMSSDLVVFNGVTTDSDPNAGTDTPRLTTRERGRSLAAGEERWLWKHEEGPLEGGPQSAASVAEAPQIHILDQILTHTFGYLNQPYHPYYTAVTAPTPTVFPSPPLPNRPANFYVGSPALVAPMNQPFPWLTWNNRPYVSQYELMMVPTSRSSRLPYDYELAPPGGTSYAPNTRDRFGHLLNFFQTKDPSTGTNGSSFYRLLELTHVPSRFVDTDLYLNPNIFTGNAAGGTDYFHPPFNQISRYRDPGRINLNTIYLRGIWNGVLAGHDGANWRRFVSSRRGYGAALPNIFQLDPDSPTFFANPFRPPGSSRLVPPTAVANKLDRLDVESTLLRSNSVPYTATPTTPLLEKTSNEPYNDTDRNPYFRRQEINRLGNLVTTRSNVYAVWMTVGFFEVEPSPDANTPAGLKVHPDGFRLGKELGEENGTVQRHRAFYIIDRSVPVAFEPGENHNVDRAIKLRRFIE